MAARITTYKQAFEDVLGIKFGDEIKEFVKKMEVDGHTERSISYAIWRSQYKLNIFKQEKNFLNILRNEINKWSWRKDDPRWEEYWKKKGEIEKAAAIRRLCENKERLKRKEIMGERSDKIAGRRLNTGKHLKCIKGYIYFIQGECGGAIKIGYSETPENRLKTLQTGYPDMLKTLLLVPGNEDTEKMFHRKYEKLRLNGEWFKPEKELLEEIEKLKRSDFDV